MKELGADNQREKSLFVGDNKNVFKLTMEMFAQLWIY